MASLPALPSVGTFRLTKSDNKPSATQVDAKLTLAQHFALTSGPGWAWMKTADVREEAHPRPTRTDCADPGR